jgi:DNA topoisomerase IA
MTQLIKKNSDVAASASSSPKLAYDLESIQKEAFARFGYSDLETRSTLDFLYESGLTSYPRASCRYLPEAEYPKARKIINHVLLCTSNQNRDKKPTLNHKGEVWNDSECSSAAHHGLMPTDISAAAVFNTVLTEQQLNIYRLVCENFLDLFIP